MANARPHVSRRPPPELEPQPDGSLRFQGHVFEATIRPDGTVAFVDAPPVQGNGVGLTFDITDRIERAVGNDPYAYERRWFLESTQELRDDLASRHRDHAARRGVVLVWRQAEAIWTSGRLAAARRRALFELWDACDEDQRMVREAILDFIRAALPEDSAEAYTPAELRAYAARRTSRAPFTPY
ncbi:MAG: hypothetical protein CMN30_24965 [Sandaracinus sp.]|nr:hypothetical protein [Sandaracinus sp.]|tara:strand:- start:2969 stop:3520 length:552 start_codon:yes stop_codon:yes gene_type:complete